jgi:hypothetical protein
VNHFTAAAILSYVLFFILFYFAGGLTCSRVSLAAVPQSYGIQDYQQNG